MKKASPQIAVLCFMAASFFFTGFARGAEFIEKDAAVVRVMNKAAGKVQNVSALAGKSTEFEKLSLLVRACKQTAPYQAENFYMFAEIEKNGKRIFSGWMDRNDPGGNPLQDADYDLWLVKCE